MPAQFLGMQTYGPTEESLDDDWLPSITLGPPAFDGYAVIILMTDCKFDYDVYEYGVYSSIPSMHISDTGSDLKDINFSGSSDGFGESGIHNSYSIRIFGCKAANTEGITFRPIFRRLDIVDPPPAEADNYIPAGGVEARYNYFRIHVLFWSSVTTAGSVGRPDDIATAPYGARNQAYIPNFGAPTTWVVPPKSQINQAFTTQTESGGDFVEIAVLSIRGSSSSDITLANTIGYGDLEDVSAQTQNRNLLRMATVAVPKSGNPDITGAVYIKPLPAFAFSLGNILQKSGGWKVGEI